MSQIQYPFNPHLGPERIVLNQEPKTGALYFTTDTRKIYLDLDQDHKKIPMGGNVGLFYGNMKLTSPPVDGQDEFTFKITEIVGNEKGVDMLQPNVNDLILNSDGCFYKVASSSGTGINMTLDTKKLTIAGSGGGGGGGSNDPNSLASAKLSRLNFASGTSVLYGEECWVEFATYITNDLGDPLVGTVGSFQLYIDGALVDLKGSNKVVGTSVSSIETSIANVPVDELNRIDVGPYLPRKDSGIEVKISATCNGITFTRAGIVYATELTLTWNYDETTINHYNSDDSYMSLEWKTSGNNIEKITYITIDDKIQVPPIRNFKTDQNYSLYFKEYNLQHGAHKIEMYTTAIIGGIETPKKNSVCKNIIVAKDDDSSTIISCGLFTDTLTQYHTVSIPIMIYSKDNTDATATIYLMEQGIDVDKWEKVPNCNTDSDKAINYWIYTPTQSGDIQLRIICNNTTYTRNIFVEPLSLTIKEEPGYAFRIKANEISSNTALKNWEWNGTRLDFSTNFDWNNGGLKNEKDKDGSIRQYINIKAGTFLTIPYALFGSTDTLATGKTFKFIFKATNCRDYDGRILECKTDKYIASANEADQIYLNIPQDTLIEYSDTITATETTVQLLNPSTKKFDLTDKATRALFNENYIKYNDKHYQCKIDVIDDSVPDDEKQYYAFFYEMFPEKSFDGIVMNAQYATFNSTSQTLSTQYCEDRYIEFEFDISKKNGNYSYITLWIDGVPANYAIYGSDVFYDKYNTPITIGSNDCDIQLYMLKIYEKGLSDRNHLSNFIADAPTAVEMLKRYNRNQVFDSNDIMTPDLVAKANPNCLVHVYTLPDGMTKTKGDPKPGCGYRQYHGSDKASLSAQNVVIKVQGTSSERYVLAAANIDSDFYNFDYPDYPPSGFIDADNNGKQLKEQGWSMDGGSAIGINYFCTKVNVASCENANNALNQEWYNLFQPYQSLLRCKNPNARDTMQFTNGVIFMEDHNDKFVISKNDDAKGNNLFGEIGGYINSPYPRFYSIGQMGNSKDNIHVFHDTSNPKECCIEVTDNQEPQQWMISADYTDNDIDDGNEYYGFRYPKKNKNATQEMRDGWRRFVTWMAESDPCAKYAEHKATSVEEYEDFAINKKTGAPIPTFVLNEDATAYIPITEYSSDYEIYYTETEHINGYTNLPIPEETYGEEHLTLHGFKADETIQKNYTPLCAGIVEAKYKGTYNRDTYERRMAKMLKECENYLVMDSVIYHYLFIERHCMIDNVAKNTFWSTEDLVHWNLIKDYDNDTADGNDNQGKFTRTYGMEPMDKLNKNTYVFNAHQAVWFNFIAGLSNICETMYVKLEQNVRKVNGKATNVWDKDAYLELFEEWQNRIPEACWIEDYYRKYRRPYEIYDETMFNSMMEGGKKTHQRAQFETYQDIYMSSKYNGISCSESVIVIRGNGTAMAGYQVPFTLYSDCYVRTKIGSNDSIVRSKRGQTYYINTTTADFNNATINLFPAKVFSTIGSVDGGKIGGYEPEQITLSSATRLRELVISTGNDGLVNESLTKNCDFLSNNLLEKLYVANLAKYTDKLDLSACVNLREVDARNSTFTEVKIANNAPIEKLLLQNPTSLELSNLYNLNTFNIATHNRLEILNTNNIDNNNTKDLNGNLVNSQTLVEKSSQLKYYKLTDVKWKLNKPSDILSDSKINILENLFTKTPLITEHGQEKRANSLTGTLTITSAAYNNSGQGALNIYNEYSCGEDPKYPRLNMVFESPNVTLYNVNVYNGDGDIIWTRKVIPNTTLTADFFMDGPNGDLDAQSQLRKTPTAEYEYEFLKTWNVTMGNSTEAFDSSSFDYANPVYGKPITADIHFKPNFNNTKRSYTVQIILIDPTGGPKNNSVLYEKIWQYGTTLDDILNDFKQIPSVDNSQLKLLEAYDFKGYSLVKGSSTLINESFTVVDTTELYTAFKLEDNIRKVVHPEWFEVVDTSTYTDELDNEYSGRTGVTLMPKSGYLLPEKITIPATFKYNDVIYPVIGIIGFGGNMTTNSLQKITHVFMEDEKENQLYEIKEGAFYNAKSLVYFDFEKSAVRVIGNNAFRGTSALTNTSFGNKLLRLKGGAFQQALANQGAVTYILPATLASVANLSFGNTNIGGGSTLEIGTEDNLSVLKLDSNSTAFKQNSANQFATINFYSLLYEAGDSIPIQVFGQGLKDDGVLNIV